MQALHCLENVYERSTVSLTLVIHKKYKRSEIHISLGNCQAVVTSLMLTSAETVKSNDPKHSEAEQKATWQSLVCP